MHCFKLILLLTSLCVLSSNRGFVCGEEDGVLVEVEPDSGEKVAEFSEQEEAEVSVEDSPEVADNGTDVNANSTTTKTKQLVNCIPVYRDETNKTGRIIVLNNSNIGDYLLLSNLPFNGGKLDVVENGSSASARNMSGNFTSVVDDQEYSVNMLANDSAKAEPGECSVIIFYLPTCPFSVAASPHFHAIARLFPQLNVLAIDAYGLYGATIRLGVVGVPSVYFYHKSRLVSRFSKAEPRLIDLAEYLKSLADLAPVDELEMIAGDETDGPLPMTVEPTINWLYYASVAFILLVVSVKFAMSEMCKNAVARIRQRWTELLFQHEHLD